MTSIMDLFLKTRVYQDARTRRWVVDYVLPYSGHLAVDFDTWEAAWEEACGVELYKAYS